MEIIDRKTAKAEGLTHYFTGKAMLLEVFLLILVMARRIAANIAKLPDLH